MNTLPVWLQVCFTLSVEKAYSFQVALHYPACDVFEGHHLGSIDNQISVSGKVSYVRVL